jgi:hypothetical protein
MGRKKSKRPLTGIERIAQERQRQIEKEGWTPEHDAEHTSGELALAAVCYAASAADTRIYQLKQFAASVAFTDPWPWADRWDKRPYNGNVLKSPSKKQVLRMLEKAGALIAAEIDRLMASHTLCIHCDQPITDSQTANVCTMCAEQQEEEESS